MVGYFFDKEGERREWEWIEGRDIVTVLPVLDNGDIILIRNYRIPVGKYVYDIPTGVIDAEDKSPELAARRELIEETGYQTNSLLSLPTYAHSPGNSSSIVYPFIATKLDLVSKLHGDVTEDIELVVLSINEVVAMYLKNDNLFNIRVIALLHLARLKGLCEPEQKI